MDELLELLEGAKEYDHYIAALCPFHADSSPSLMVYPDRYYCTACGASGKTEYLVRKLRGKTGKIIIADTKERTRNPFGRWLRNKSLSDVLKLAKSNMSLASARGYLRGRGFTDETINKLYLGYLDGWITIPIINHHRKLAGAIVRATDSLNATTRYFVPYGQDPNLVYCPDWGRVNEAEEVFLTFGTFDAMSLYQVGYASLSTTTGKRLHPRALDHIQKKINIVPDLGEEREAANLAAKLGLRGNLFTIKYSNNTKDINDLLQIGLLD